ncbi:hypothetical protein [Tropicibacter oceani]|uniref:Uncharacterized protein n=1 Tax=Tropicibacter oceani TaxID=3058420 RepID=A0ABY8QL59_9RHOB|nr:hypothetical protein [Tropicibacter oceani]WGW04748.1 hypothetical protein QF118_04135 [Tropicibacter oceani]
MHLGKIAATAIALTAAPLALTAAPIETITQGSGPSEEVVRYQLGPDAMDFRFATDRVTALANAIASDREAARQQEALNNGLTLFGDVFGGTGVISTLAENVGQVASLNGVNTVMTYAGVLFTGVTVANDLLQGKQDAAAVGAYKGVISFAISNYGWAALQTAGTTLFIFDITLREVEAGGRNIYRDRWRPDLQRFFREDPSVARTLNDWKSLVWALYETAQPKPGQEKAPGADPFRAGLMAELDRYVGSATLEQIAFYSDASRTGGGSSGLSQTILDDLRAEHKDALLAMIARDVMPEIAQRAKALHMRRLVDQLNRDLRFKMNYPIHLDVTAWGMDGARVRIPTRSGDDWGGPLSAQGTFALDFTTFAWMKAGLPDTIVVETAQGTTLQAPLTVKGSMAAAIFGQPVTPIVTRMQLDEGDRRCTRETRTLAGEVLDEERRTFAAGPSQILDFAQLANGQIVLGSYDGATGQWASASPGLWLYGTQLHLGEPRYQGLAAMKDCNVSLFTRQGDYAEGKCRFDRERERVTGASVSRVSCTSDGTVTMKGVFADIGQGKTYYPMDDPASRRMIDEMRKAMSRIDPTMFQQMGIAVPSLPQGTEGN